VTLKLNFIAIYNDSKSISTLIINCLLSIYHFK